MAPWIITATEPSETKAEVLRAAGGEYIVLPSREQGGTQTIPWATIFEELQRRKIMSVMIEGGGAVINSLLSSFNTHLIDSVIVTIAPTWLGLGGVVVSPPRTVEHGRELSPVTRLKHTQWHQLGDDVVLCGVLT